MKNLFYLGTIALIGSIYICSCNAPKKPTDDIDFGEIAQQESATPIRPGQPGERPFWNTYSKRFIYAPAFDFKTLPDAIQYRFDISCEHDSNSYHFENRVPSAPLSPVWKKMPVGYFRLKVTALGAKSEEIAIAGQGKYYKAAAFNGPYHQAEMSYDSSGLVALSHVMHKSYVDYWLTHKKPDSSYKYYRYPAKMYSALISGAVTYAKFINDKAEAERATKIAQIVADDLLSISFPKGSAWAYFPPTYYGDWIAKLNQASYIRLDNFMPLYGTTAGDAYLDLYDLTKEEKYLEAAKKIAQSFLKNQLSNGSWNLYVSANTGEETADIGNVSIPTFILPYFARLSQQYQMEGLEKASQKAFQWIMDHPVKTFNWQGQFEDVGTHPPYKDLGRKESCQFAIYLLKNKKDDPKMVDLALELIRYSEDQFVIWEKPRLLNEKSKSKGRRSTNWITPSTQEQYVYWMPTGPAALRMAKAFWYAYTVTGEPIYLAKAKSLANTMTVVQKEHQGEYSTYFTKDPLGGEWLNCNVFSAQEMIAFDQALKKAQ